MTAMKVHGVGPSMERSCREDEHPVASLEREIQKGNVRASTVGHERDVGQEARSAG